MSKQNYKMQEEVNGKYDTILSEVIENQNKGE